MEQQDCRALTGAPVVEIEGAYADKTAFPDAGHRREGCTDTDGCRQPPTEVDGFYHPTRLARNIGLKCPKPTHVEGRKVLARKPKPRVAGLIARLRIEVDRKHPQLLDDIFGAL